MKEGDVSRKKELFLPTATSGEAQEPISTPAEVWENTGKKRGEGPEGSYPCPCCGCLTFPVPKEEAVAYICPVCMWENDVFDPGEDDPSEENRGMTLRQGRAAYGRLGAVCPDLVQYARPPRPEELPPKNKTR